MIRTHSPFDLPLDPLAELTRLCRRICLQREHQPELSQRSLDEDLANALAIILEKHGSTAATADDVNRIYASELQRLEDAVTLAEILIAKLAQRPATSSPQPQISNSKPEISPAPRPTSTPAKPSGPTPGIADLLDGMLAQQRSPRTG